MATSEPKRPWETSPWRSFQEPAPASPSSSIGSMLGTIAIAVGVGMLGAYMLDLHTHTCEACGHHWRHLGAFNHGDPVAHTCSKCGTVQWWKDGAAHVFRDALRQPPPKVLPDGLVARLQEIGGAPHQALSSITSLAWAPREIR